MSTANQQEEGVILTVGNWKMGRVQAERLGLRSSLTTNNEALHPARGLLWLKQESNSCASKLRTWLPFRSFFPIYDHCRCCLIWMQALPALLPGYSLHHFRYYVGVCFYSAGIKYFSFQPRKVLLRSNPHINHKQNPLQRQFTSLLFEAQLSTATTFFGKWHLDKAYISVLIFIQIHLPDQK